MARTLKDAELTSDCCNAIMRAKYLMKDLQYKHPSRENALVVTKLEEAYMWFSEGACITVSEKPKKNKEGE